VPSKKPARCATVAVSLQPGEKTRLKRSAKQAKKTVSTLIRDVLAAAKVI